jgi:hypothetical protein
VSKNTKRRRMRMKWRRRSLIILVDKNSRYTMILRRFEVTLTMLTAMLLTEISPIEIRSDLSFLIRKA